MGSFYLFAQPSFIGGVARLLDFAGSLNEYNYSRTRAEADTVALSQDWQAVGSDISMATKKYGQSLEKENG